MGNGEWGMGNGEEIDIGLNNVFPLVPLLPTPHMKDLLIATDFN
jgi:hypothetical protein